TVASGDEPSPAHGDQEELRVAVRNERGLTVDVVVREAVGEPVDGMVVPELGVVVRRCGQVVPRRVGLLGRWQRGDVAVEGGAHGGIAGQAGRTPEDVGRRRVYADRGRVRGEVVRVDP